MFWGGIVTLLSSVLDITPLFYLLFYIEPKIIIQDIIKIQRDFLLHREENKKKVNWVSWKIICKSKHERILGVKDCETFNKALLSNWDWKVVLNEVLGLL